MTSKKTKNFEVCARAIIIKAGKVLVCRPINESWYFFPGGHIEFGEKAEDTLKRELKEETGAQLTGVSFIGTIEHYYQEKETRRHEFNLVFNVELEDGEIQDIEDHIEFAWIELDDLRNKEILPVALKDAVADWIENKKCFWISSFE